jgi:hypothetical protein
MLRAWVTRLRAHTAASRMLCEHRRCPRVPRMCSQPRQVPAYLLERKMQLAQEHEALMAAKAAAAIPPGARVGRGGRGWPPAALTPATRTPMRTMTHTHTHRPAPR